jgi:hypothetical protein
MYVDRSGAYQHLADRGIKLGTGALEKLAMSARGPKYTIIHGRALYKREWLDEWVETLANRASPSGPVYDKHRSQRGGRRSKTVSRGRKLSARTETVD